MLVWEAVARRYLPISSKHRAETNLISVSTFLNDHAGKILSKESVEGICGGLAFIGVGKYKLEDEPHRAFLRAIEKFMLGQGYVYNGFAIDFRGYGEQFETVTLVYTRPDLSRSVHMIYDNKFEVPPLFLFKMTREAWGQEYRDGRIKSSIKPRPADNPFAAYGQWYTDFDRHSQRWLVTKITRPDAYLIAQFPFEQQYAQFEQQTRLQLKR